MNLSEMREFEARNAEANLRALRQVEEMDDYKRAADYLIGKALSSGDGFMLRAIKTLMDKAGKEPLRVRGNRK